MSAIEDDPEFTLDWVQVFAVTTLNSLTSDLFIAEAS